MSINISDINAQKKINVMKNQGQLDYGIVFCGGGAKGAFQLGVWKKLEELGVAERFTGISGASVGALNALLFAQGDYEKAEAAWMKMKEDDLIQLNEVLEYNLLKNLGKEFFSAANVYGIWKDLKKNARVNRDKLERIVRETITWEFLNDKLIFVSLSELKLRVKKIGKKGFVMKRKYAYLDPSDSIDINIKKVMASAAHPGAYAPVVVNGKPYIDGGAMDNEPVCPMIKAGYRNILVVHPNGRWNRKNGRDREETFGKILRKNYSEEELEGVKICHIWSQCYLGNLLKINPDLTQERIEAGYEAASKQLKASFFQK